MTIKDKLIEYQDVEYGDFIAKLTPSINRDSIIGVRVPTLREIAKKFPIKEIDLYLHSLPHQYYEENLVHGFLIQQIKDYQKCINELEAFLPYVDNWAVCDTMIPRVFKKNKKDVLKHIHSWIKTKKTYTVRFAIGCLMDIYLDEDFDEKYLDEVSSIVSDEYYVNMMIAWYLATALSKQWDKTIKIIESKKLNKWIQNKTIQKANESFRITIEQRNYLKTLKI